MHKAHVHITGMPNSIQTEMAIELLYWHYTFCVQYCTYIACTFAKLIFPQCRKNQCFQSISVLLVSFVGLIRKLIRVYCILTKRRSGCKTIDSNIKAAQWPHDGWQQPRQHMYARSWQQAVCTLTVVHCQS